MPNVKNGWENPNRKKWYKSFHIQNYKLYTVFTVTGLQEKNPKSHSSFQTNQTMSPNCIVLRTLTRSSHVFHKGENRVFRTLSAPVTRIELSTARAASGESDANWPPTSIFYLIFLRNCHFQNHKNQPSTQKKTNINQKKQLPLDVLVCCFFGGCFQHTAKGLLQNSWSWVVQTSSSSSKLPRNCFFPKSCDADRKDWVHRPPPKNPWKIPRNMGVLLTPVLKRKETWGSHGMVTFMASKRWIFPDVLFIILKWINFILEKLSVINIWTLFVYNYQPYLFLNVWTNLRVWPMLTMLMDLASISAFQSLLLRVL